MTRNLGVKFLHLSLRKHFFQWGNDATIECREKLCAQCIYEINYIYLTLKEHRIIHLGLVKTDFFNFLQCCMYFCSLIWGWRKNWERCCLLLCTMKASLSKIHSEFSFISLVYPFLWFHLYNYSYNSLKLN